jgi:hypothetical protein
MPPVRSMADLDRFWRMIKGPWGFSVPQLFCAVFTSSGDVTPIIINIDDCADGPDTESIGNLFHVLTRVVDENAAGGSVAMMFARPGTDGIEERDRQWARELTTSGQHAAIDVWPVYLGDDDRVRVVAPDDLAA